MIDPPQTTAPTGGRNLATRAERHAKGKLLRGRTPRSEHAAWSPPADRIDPIELVEASSRGRMPSLVPIRYARMLVSPFTFLRGSAALMAHDLARTPVTGLRVQACGDCHLLNFGTFGSPERALLFDVSDFDETLPAPWEWDVKRLATSFVLAGRATGLSEGDGRDAALACVRSYRRRMLDFAAMHVLEVWYARIEVESPLELSHRPRIRESREKGARRAAKRAADRVVKRLTVVVDGRRRIADNPPLIFHQPAGDPFEQDVRELFHHYRRSLPDERRALLDRYEPIDLAMKVVGVGSVGTRCAVALMSAGADDHLILQFKEAGASVLEPHAGKSGYANQGQRVVVGQRLMQSASDIFLGWSRAEKQGFDYYFRQLRDMKGSVDLAAMSAGDLTEYAGFCGWALARAHARTGDAVQLAGYLGPGEAFELAIAQFAVAYADQTERDHSAFQQAVRAGRLAAQFDSVARG
ncbi:MAG TPA: DUF2252 domain-containing protein [Pirellulales bacterium]|nr:DUF2252 domain-containing protein [Pirellulales bacterium]